MKDLLSVHVGDLRLDLTSFESQSGISRINRGALISILLYSQRLTVNPKRKKLCQASLTLPTLKSGPSSRHSTNVGVKITRLSYSMPKPTSDSAPVTGKPRPALPYSGVTADVITLFSRPACKITVASFSIADISNTAPVFTNMMIWVTALFPYFRYRPTMPGKTI